MWRNTYELQKIIDLHHWIQFAHRINTYFGESRHWLNFFCLYGLKVSFRIKPKTVMKIINFKNWFSYFPSLEGPKPKIFDGTSSILTLNIWWKFGLKILSRTIFIKKNSFWGFFISVRHGSTYGPVTGLRVGIFKNRV